MSNHIIEQIIANADIVKIIGKHVELKRSGNEFKGCCPFHGEKTPSFFVNPQKGFYNCFGCGAKGNALTFLKDYEHLTASEALQTLAHQTGIELPKEPLKKTHTYQRTPLNSPSAKPSPSPVPAVINGLENGDQSTLAGVSAAPNPRPPHTPNITQSLSQNALAPSLTDNLANHLTNNLADLAQGTDTWSDWHGMAASGAAELDKFDMPTSMPAWADIPYDEPDRSAEMPVGFGDEDIAEQDDGSSSLYDLLVQIGLFYQQQLAQNALAQNYFLSRGLTQATIEEFGLGYAPTSWNHLEHAFPRDIEGLKLLGLVRTSHKGTAYDLLRHRVIFPIRDTQGRIVGFAGRALNDEDMPKYINSSDSPVFHKQHLLYGLYEGRKARAKDWLVVEGYMDVISLHQAGVYGAVASMGTAIATSQIDKLLQLNPVLTLSFDGDSAGQKAAWRAMEVGLPVLNDGKELRFLTLPNNHDPDSFVKAYGSAAMQSQISNAIPLSQYVFSVLSRRHDINIAEGRGKLLAEVSELTKKLPKGSYGWLLREDMRSRMGLGKRAQARTAHDALVNFESELTPQLVLQMCLLYQPELLGEKRQGQLNQALIEQIFALSTADQLPFFPIRALNKDDQANLSDEEKQHKIALAVADNQRKTAQHLAHNPIQPLTWQQILDDKSLQLVDWIQHSQQAIADYQQNLERAALHQAVAEETPLPLDPTFDEYEIINAKAHFILAGLPKDTCQALAGRWSRFFTQLSERYITDVSALVTEILARQIIEALQQQVKTEKDIANKQYYKRQSQAIHQWYNAWLQQKEE